MDNPRVEELNTEKHSLQNELEQHNAARQKRENAKTRLDQIFTILEGLKNHPLAYDDQIVRQILECVIVESKEKI